MCVYTNICSYACICVTGDFPDKILKINMYDIHINTKVNFFLCGVHNICFTPMKASFLCIFFVKTEFYNINRKRCNKKTNRNKAEMYENFPSTNLYNLSNYFKFCNIVYHR